MNHPLGKFHRPRFGVGLRFSARADALASRAGRSSAFRANDVRRGPAWPAAGQEYRASAAD